MAQQGTGCGPADPARVSTHLCGEFALAVDAAHLPLPEIAAKVVAYVALEQRPVTRRTLVGVLWPRS